MFRQVSTVVLAALSAIGSLNCAGTQVSMDAGDHGRLFLLSQNTRLSNQDIAM